MIGTFDPGPLARIGKLNVIVPKVESARPADITRLRLRRLHDTFLLSKSRGDLQHLSEALIGVLPGDDFADWHSAPYLLDFADDIRNLAPFLHALGDRQEGELLHRAALVFSNFGYTGRAAELYSRAIDLFNRASAYGSQCRALIALGTISHGDGNPSQAEAYYRHAIEIARREELSDLLIASGIGNLASMHFDNPLLLRQAESEIAATIELQRRQLIEGDTSDYAWTLLIDAVIQERLGRPRNAQRQLRTGMEFKTAEVGNDHPVVAFFHSNSAKFALRRGDIQRAIADSDRAVGIWRSAFSDEHPLGANFLYTRARIARASGELRLASTLMEHAQDCERMHAPKRSQEI